MEPDGGDDLGKHAVKRSAPPFDAHYQRPFPPLLPGPKATIVFVVVIDIVFHPYNTKPPDHDSDANVKVERVF